MINMKNYLIISGAILIAISAFAGCKKDSGLDVRDAFVATYSVAETWTENGKQLTKPAFTMSVEKSSQNSEKLLLNNFANYGAGITVEATLKNNVITIAQQTLPNLKGIIGSGTFTGTSLIITYTEVQGSTSIAVTAIANKL